MLRQGSQEIPGSFTPQWLQQRQGQAAAAGANQDKQQQQSQASPTAAARREEKPWVAERWSSEREKDADSKWSHDPPFDRPRWGEDERDRERLVPRPQREPGRCVLMLKYMFNS
jgi:hypothetical protein